MSIDNSQKQTYEKIRNLINSSRLNEAFMLLKNRVKSFPTLQQYLFKLKDLENNYKYMLDYVIEGHPDPSQKDMIEQFKDTLHSANDLLLRENKLVDSSDIYSSTKRVLNVRNASFQSVFELWKTAFDMDNPFSGEDIIEAGKSFVISSLQADAINDLFNYIWTSTGEKEDVDGVTQLMDNDNVPEYLKADFISALTLANIEYFNPEYYETFIHVYETSDSTILRARALTAILLIALLHANRLKGNLRLRSRLMLFTGDEEIKKIINDTLLNIIKTYDTKRVDNKMRNEVIPGLMKAGPEIIDKMKNLSSDSEDFLSMENPAWEEMMADSDIGEKIQEINDMQLEGADVMVTTFSHLKNFPFFNNISNWFLPFTTGFYLFNNLVSNKEDNVLTSITNVMCDSDAHSLLLSMSSLPQERRDQTLNMMNHQIKEAREAFQNNIGEETEHHKITRKIRHTLQDIYRFYKFYRRKDDFNDPFEAPFIASHIAPLMSVLGLNLENIRLVAEFYFKNKYFDEATGLFEMIDKESSGDFTLWEKIGFGYDKMQLYDEASKWYHKAELMNPDSAWLNKKLALTLKNAGRYGEALKYFEKALKSETENYHLLMSMGQCLLEDNQPEKALQHFYHANYLKPEKRTPLRAIAWAELLAGNVVKAQSQYEKILREDKVDATDYLNAAHAAMVAGNLKNAKRLYYSFVEHSDKKDITSLVLALRDDSETLKKLGIKTADLRLIVDKIRYDIFDREMESN